MDPVGTAQVNDAHAPSPTYRQSILGSFLRVRPRGASQSQQAPPNLALDTHDAQPAHSTQPTIPFLAASGTVVSPSMFSHQNQPPSPSAHQQSHTTFNPLGVAHHRRNPAAGVQPSVSTTTSPVNVQHSNSIGGGVHSFSHILRRRRSANGALNTSPSQSAALASPLNVDGPSAAQSQSLPRPVQIPSVPHPSDVALNGNAGGGGVGVGGGMRSHRIRLVPHLDANRSLQFDPISRDVREGDVALRIGRFTDRSGQGVAALNAQNTNKLAFKSKVVSRSHAEVWCAPGGKFFIKDTKSSSGTFLNHSRLSPPNTDSKPFPIKDGDLLQLGVDYQGGTEEIYKCVKMKIELGREWQNQANAFNMNAMKQLKALSAPRVGEKAVSTTKVCSAPKASGISDCCICLFGVTVHQSLFIAPCSHVFHYKCIRPMLNLHHPGFSCPLCRTFANLDEDVEVEYEDEGGAETEDADGSGSAEGPTRGGTTAPESHGGERGMDVDMLNVSAVLTAANEVAAQLNSANSNNLASVPGPGAPLAIRMQAQGIVPLASTTTAGDMMDFLPGRGRAPNAQSNPSNHDYGAATLVRGDGRAPSLGLVPRGGFDQVLEDGETEGEGDFASGYGSPANDNDSQSGGEGTSTAAIPGRSLSPASASATGGGPSAVNVANSPMSAVSPSFSQMQIPREAAGERSDEEYGSGLDGSNSGSGSGEGEVEEDASEASAEGAGGGNATMVGVGKRKR